MELAREKRGLECLVALVDGVQRMLEAGGKLRSLEEECAEIGKSATLVQIEIAQVATRVVALLDRIAEGVTSDAARRLVDRLRQATRGAAEEQRAEVSAERDARVTPLELRQKEERRQVARLAGALAAVGALPGALHLVSWSAADGSGQATVRVTAPEGLTVFAARRLADRHPLARPLPVGDVVRSLLVRLEEGDERPAELRRWVIVGFETGVRASVQLRAPGRRGEIVEIVLAAPGVSEPALFHRAHEGAPARVRHLNGEERNAVFALHAMVDPAARDLLHLLLVPDEVTLGGVPSERVPPRDLAAALVRGAAPSSWELLGPALAAAAAGLAGEPSPPHLALARRALEQIQRVVATCTPEDRQVFLGMAPFAATPPPPRRLPRASSQAVADPGDEPDTVAIDPPRDR
jgi:hypothetical protein